MNQREKAYATTRIRGILATKKQEINDTKVSFESEWTSTWRPRVIKAVVTDEKVMKKLLASAIHHHVDRDWNSSYTKYMLKGKVSFSVSMDNIVPGIKKLIKDMEKAMQSMEDAHNARISKAEKEAEKITDKINLGDCQEAMDLIEKFAKTNF
jgi:hypothetical protein